MKWQSFASTQIEEVFFGTNVWPRLNATDRALVRSQRGPTASIPFHTPPVSAASRFDPQCFRVLLLRRLWCQLPLSSATCRCGQPHDSRGHHCGACATAGFWVAEGIRWRVVRHGSRTKHAQHRAQRRATRVRSERLLVRSRLSNFVALKASGHRGFCPLSFGPRCAPRHCLCPPALSLS